jgi:hypothetical protein
MIYGVAQNWTTTLSCQHAIDTTSGIRITLPSDFYVISTSNCVMGGQNTKYSCGLNNGEGTITVMNFLKSNLAKEK